jgi:hypothetical protein
MPNKVFISYCHKQGEWVWDRLVPCLKAGGAEVLIDHERFKAGKAVMGQMDTVQDQAESHLLILSPDYLGSKYCTHEMRRAIDTDPHFTEGTVIPVLLADCKLPNLIKRPNPLFVDLRDTRDCKSWDALLQACCIDLGVTAPDWLDVRDKLRQDLKQERSVNLVVSGQDVAWRGLIDHLTDCPSTSMTRVDLYSARTIERHGLLASMLSESEGEHRIPPAPGDLAAFQRELESRAAPSRVALIHFDQTQHRDYGADYFTTLRYMVTEKRKLLLLIQSRAPFQALLKPDARSILSQLDIKSMELKGRR